MRKSLVQDSQLLESYLQSRFGPSARVVAVRPLGGPSEEGGKSYGYGIPLRIDYMINGHSGSAVLETVRPGPFGHEHMADRAQNLLWAHQAFNELPAHARSLDVGAFRTSGELVSLGDAQEFFLLMDFVEGREYAEDLDRIRKSGIAEPLDFARADALCDYLVRIHSNKGPEGSLYERRVRELVGHGECIMGIADSYPEDDPFVIGGELEDIERRCLAWRWRLKGRVHRLRTIHGDFHPWNILFREGADFTVLDRSRGEWGDPADDVACLTVNYLFFSLQRSGRLEGPFEALFLRFWDRYLSGSGDAEVLEVVAPFLAFRGLVMASPVWYPNLPGEIRRKLFAFMRNVLKARRFNPRSIDSYCEA